MMETVKQKINIFERYTKELIILSWPMIIGNMGNMLIGVEDVFVAAKHSTDTLAAISVATAIFMSIFISGIGLLMSISPIVSNRRGGKKRSKNLLMMTVIYSLILSVIFFAITRLSLIFIEKIGLTPVLTPLVKEYIDICSFSIFGAYLYNALKEFLQAYEIVLFPNIVSLAAIIINPFICFALVFGWWGLPALGVKGLAITAVIIRTFMGLSLFVFCHRFLRNQISKTLEYIKELLKVGWPIAVSLFVEFSGFNITAILVGKISSVLTAAHNIIITFASTTFMIPLAISNAMAVKIGYANGQKNLKSLKRYAIYGIAMIFLFMSFTAFMFVKFPIQLIQIFTTDPLVIQAALPVILIVAGFQIFDGLQVGFSGVLKGLKLTKPIMLTTAIAYWIIGIPLGCTLAFKYNQGLYGLWMGLAVALLSAAIISGIIIMLKLKQMESKRS